MQDPWFSYTLTLVQGYASKLWDSAAGDLAVLQTAVLYSGELETTIQDERGMNRLRVKAQFFFLCRNVY